jgi:hypothetical protein
MWRAGASRSSQTQIYIQKSCITIVTTSQNINALHRGGYSIVTGQGGVMHYIDAPFHPMLMSIH